MSTEEKETLSAATYVLGLIDPLKRRQLDKRLDEDADFAAEVTRWQKAFSAIDVTSREVAPSPGLWQLIARDLVPPQTAHAASTVRNRSLFWLGWALAAALGGVVIFTQVIKPDAAPALQTIAILNDKQSERQFVVMLDKSVLTHADNLPSGSPGCRRSDRGKSVRPARAGVGAGSCRVHIYVGRDGHRIPTWIDPRFPR